MFLKNCKATFIAMALPLMFLVGCTEEKQAPATVEPPRPVNATPVIAVGNYPLLYIVKRITGDDFSILYQIPPGIDPAYWKPNRDQLKAVQSADLILLNGATYEKWEVLSRLPKDRILHTAKAFHDQWIDLESEIVHSHGAGGAHTHSGKAFTTWLDPTLASKQAMISVDWLTKLKPSNQELYKDNIEALTKDFLELDQLLEGITKDHQAVPIVASHPVYQYFQRRYGLNIDSVHWEPSEAPSIEDWAEFTALIEKFPARLMMWEDEPLAETREKLNKMGITSFVYSPCGNQPETGDFLTVMKQNAENLKSAFESLNASSSE